MAKLSTLSIIALFFILYAAKRVTQHQHRQQLYIFRPIQARGSRLHLLAWVGTSPHSQIYSPPDTTNTRAFIILKDGKIVVEHYAEHNLRQVHSLPQANGIGLPQEKL
ncbi:MAG: hypothetical protein QM734_17885 [Cyclobacteriaceae bacterium]